MILVPSTNPTIYGGHYRPDWSYLLTLGSPTDTTSRTYPADRVLHLFYATSPATPWLGISPIEASGTTKTMLANMEKRLAEEVGGPVGHLLPVPNVDSTSQLQTDINNMKGGTRLTESTSKNWGAGSTGAPAQDYGTKRIGGEPPIATVQLRRQAEESLSSLVAVCLCLQSRRRMQEPPENSSVSSCTWLCSPLRTR